MTTAATPQPQGRTRWMRNTNARRVVFQISLISAASKLLGLRLALLNEIDCESALDHAVRARRSIVEAYERWSGLEDWEEGVEWLAELRNFGHLVLASQLHVAVVVHAKDTEVEQRALTVALHATLWKVADALDRVERHLN